MLAVLRQSVPGSFDVCVSGVSHAHSRGYRVFCSRGYAATAGCDGPCTSSGGCSDGVVVGLSRVLCRSTLRQLHPSAVQCTVFRGKVSVCTGTNDNWSDTWISVTVGTWVCHISVCDVYVGPMLALMQLSEDGVRRISRMSSTSGAWQHVFPGVMLIPDTTPPSPHKLPYVKPQSALGSSCFQGFQAVTHKRCMRARSVVRVPCSALPCVGSTACLDVVINQHLLSAAPSSSSRSSVLPSPFLAPWTNPPGHRHPI